MSMCEKRDVVTFSTFLSLSFFPYFFLSFLLSFFFFLSFLPSFDLSFFSCIFLSSLLSFFPSFFPPFFPYILLSLLWVFSFLWVLRLLNWKNSAGAPLKIKWENVDWFLTSYTTHKHLSSTRPNISIDQRFVMPFENADWWILTCTNCEILCRGE